MKKTYYINLLCLLFVTNMACAQIWTQKANYADTATNSAVGFSIGTKGYIFTGGKTSHAFYEWDQSTNTWTRKADFPGLPLWGAVGFSIGNKGYIGTGEDSIGYPLDFWEWNQATNTWTRKADFGGAGRVTAVGFSIGTKGYIGTGWSSGKDFWEWDGDTASLKYNTWTRMADFGGTARNSAIGFSIGNKGYIGTGNDGTLPNPVKADFWEWDGDTASPTYNTWTQKANCGGGATQDAVAFAIGTQGFVCRSSTQDFWAWDQVSNTWIKELNFAGVARSTAIGFSIGNKGYIGTGQDNSLNLLQDFWEYSDTTVGVNEINYSQNIAIYPNPTNDKIYIQRTNDGAMEVSLYDIVGKQVSATVKSEYQITEVHVNNIPKGVYILKCTINNNSLNKKVVIE